MKQQSKKVIALLLAAILIMGMLPSNVYAASGDTARVFVTDVDGNPIPNAVVTVKYRYFTFLGWNEQAVNINQSAQGIYTFSSRGNGYYQITVTCPGYTDYNYTTSSRMDPSTSTTFTVMLSQEGSQYQEFGVYYYISNNDKRFPDSYYASGDSGNYGPSRNDTPLVTITVDVAKLQRMENVVYEEGNSNIYHFIPEGETQDEAAAKAFWAAVWECTTEESKKDFEATGLANSFVGYCVKQQSNDAFHIDGVLDVTPPIYVIEMYENNVYFAGEATDSTVAGMDVYDVLAFCENHLQQTITWTEDDQGRPALTDGKYTGTYISNNHLYTVTITQRAMNNASLHTSGLYYDKINEQYYLAQFDVVVTDEGAITYTVTYTDGVADEVVYNDHAYAAEGGDTVPAYTGIYTREGYTFQGWILEGGDGSVLTDEQVQALPVEGDMTFHAVWQLVPKYTGRVELVLNGIYDSATHTATGERISAESIRGDGVQLYVKEENASKYIPLEKTGEVGVYTASLENGNYYFFYSKDGGNTMVSTGNQQLTIYNEDRTRYLFYNSVTYDLNGGTGGPAELTQYYRSGYSVNVATETPTKDKYLFTSWKAQDGTVYQSGELLTQDIGEAHTLTAQWETVTKATVNLQVIIDHNAVSGEGTDPQPAGELTTNLMYRANDTEPYVEVVGKKIIRTDWYDEDPNQDNITTVTYEPFFAQLSTDFEYSANAFLEHYYNVERTVTTQTDANGNVTYDVTIHLQYNPDLFQLEYNIVADEKSIPDNLIPKAVDLKIISWDAQEEGAWAPISRHKDYSVDVAFNGRQGTGSYNVVAHRADHSHYYYRVRPVGFTLADGTELVTTAVRDQGDEYYIYLSDPSGKYAQGAFYALVTVEGGQENVDGISANGVYAKSMEDGNTEAEHVQQGTITVTVYANLYDVTFVPNGGSLLDSKDNTVLTDQTSVPELNNYIPTRDGGYVFEGWYLADENGQMTAQTVQSNTGLTGDITLIAKWRDPITVTGDIAVAGSFQQENEDGSITTQIIQTAGRPTSVVVALQHIDANGYAQTYYTQTVNLTYGEDHIGRGSYRFEGLHDEAHDHRILVLAPNYSALYQNEPDSLDVDKRADYANEYDESSYLVVKGEDDAQTPDVNEAKTAVVNAYLPFNPSTFQLNYQVDASQIGEGFRPKCARILITCDTDPLIIESSQWPVISQMIFDGAYIGNHTELSAEGIGNGSEPVWLSFPDGTTLYEYALRVQSTNFGGEDVPYDAQTASFTVEYVAPAHWVAPDSQNQLLKATLVPKQYPINYVLNGGSFSGTCPQHHTWSKQTDLSGAVPVRAGYAFEGWYLNEALTEAAPAVITAGTAEEKTLYAKWAVAKDTVTLHVTVNHMHHEDGSEADDYEKDLYVQLMRAPRDTEEFVAVAGQEKTYGPVYWHTAGDDADVEESYIVPVFAELSNLYDYTLDVSMEGYFLAEAPQINKVVHEDGSTTHEISVVLQFATDLLYMSFNVEMAEEMPAYLYPQYAQVKVTCWYEVPDQAGVYDWQVITQHETAYVQVPLDSDGNGTGTCPVWQWETEPDENGENGLPFYYRIQPIALGFENGAVVTLSGENGVTYTGANYTATVQTEGACVNPDSENTALSGVYGTRSGEHYVQTGTIKAIINATEQPVVFHANNAACAQDVFRTYYPTSQEEQEHRLNSDGTITGFYDIPAFEGNTHNDYIFKGWYLDADSDARPIRWGGTDEDTVFAGVTDVYAHWIRVGEVAKNVEDGKDYPGPYSEYDLVGVQIRTSNKNIYDPEHYHGTTGAGLRFVAVLSQNVYDQLQALSLDNAITAGAEQPMEYGFAVATKSATDSRATGNADYRIQYNGMVNGEDTSTAYKYVRNMVCSGPSIIDHYKDDNYRLYTAVITYNGSGYNVEEAKGRDFVARAYLRYNDANGLYRTHYNNYEGTQVYGGCSISYNGALAFSNQTQ